MSQQHPFKYTVQHKDRAVQLVFSGLIDETARLPEVDMNQSQLVINLGKVENINSAGTRNWIIWIGRITHAMDVYLEECPPVFVRNINNVKGFTPLRVRVASVYLPYYSELTGERKDILCRIGKEILPGGKINVPVPSDSHGRPMELDIIPEVYLAFVK